ncbi:hypothetical protein V5799_007199 [Amblyomma americanum]|uniref:Fatty acid synthase n=1 Tax=Amblyomma americanum TaxID=6943 RepID=A0AAQ4DU78_AMBAM
MAAAEEDIVISGLSARFPQADSFAEFKEKLYAGADFVTDDETRWPRGYLGLPERMGKIRDLSLFDAEFFGVPPKQAHRMDPQMRLLLETSYEAMVDAGYDPSTWRGRAVGVFIGCYSCEAQEASSCNPDKVDGYAVMSSSQGMLANRISYSFDLHGPSVAIDTACSSTMAALNHAVGSIRSGECEAAIVGGSTICLKPTTSLNFQRLGVLSPDGKCMSFDASSNGYVRSETVGVFFIQRALEARRIYAKITHVKAYSDGYKHQGFIHPSSEAQEQLLRCVYAEAKVDPRDVGYVEAHGTGTPAGDVPELCAISKVFRRSGRDKPLKVGAVKSNVGHAEAASGISSIAKVLLAMETGTIAGNLHFKEANPNIPPLLDRSIEVVDKNTPFPGGPVGINSFGLGGCNVHVILEPGQEPHVNNIPRDKCDVPRLVLAAGRSEELLMRTLLRLEEEGPLPDSAYALLNRVGQPSAKHFPYRGFAVIPVDGSSKEVVKVVEQASCEKRPLWFAFTGMGCHWKAMARQMMQFDVFARSLRKSHDCLSQYGVNLIDSVTNDKTENHSMASVQASIAAVQVALVDTLGAVGIQPDGLVGHSVGEIGCAYADGCLTAEQAVVCAYWRGHCIDMGKLPKGAMAATGLTWEEAERRCRDGVVPACHNAQCSVTVSGPAQCVADLVAELKAEGVFAREVDTMNVAFHSDHMQSIAPSFKEALQKVVSEVKPRSERWLSTSVPMDHWQESLAKNCSVDYLVNNLVAPVLFHEALLQAPTNAILVEIGPHCLLQPILRHALGPDASSLGLMKRGEDNLTFFLKALGKLHTFGVRVDLSPLYPPVQFPVPRGTPTIGHLVSWDHSQRWTVAKWSDFAGAGQFSEEVVEVNLDTNERDAYLAGHQLDGRVIYPASGYMVLVWKSFAKRCGKPFDQMPVVFENLTLHRATILPKSGTVRFLVLIMPASGEFEVSEGGSVAASGRIRMAKEGEEVLDNGLPCPSNEAAVLELNSEEVYKEQALSGCDYHGVFQSILSVDLDRPQCKLKWEDNWVAFIDGMFQFYSFLQPLRTLKLLAKIQSCHIDPRLHAQVVEEAAERGIPSIYDGCLNAGSAGGVVIRGYKSSVAPRRSSRQTPCLEEYCFVPYVDNEAAILKREARLREYVDVCSAIVRCILQTTGEEMNEVSRLLKESCDVPKEVFDQHLKSNGENNGLVRVLTGIQTRINVSGSPLASAVEWALTTHKNDLDKDIIYTALLEEDPLRHLLDVAVENTSGRKIRVLELAPEGSNFLLTLSVSGMLPLYDISLKTEYAVAYQRPHDLAPQHLPEGVVTLLWDPASTSGNKLPEADLVIARIVPSVSNCLETLAEELSAHCKETGFALVFLRSALTPAEVFLSKVANLPSTTHTKDAVMSVLGYHGFRLVALKSNKWSTLLLLRKITTEPGVSQQEMMLTENANFDWVETLKEKVIECAGSLQGITCGW